MATASCAAAILEPAMDESQLLDLNGPAFRLAARILGSAENAQDAVQQAYLAALVDLRKGAHPDVLRAWFLKVVANTALRQLRGEDRRRRREASTMMEARQGSEVGAGAELVTALRVAVAHLEEKYRLPVALCCEEGLTRQEAAAVLDMPESTVKKYVSLGLDELRKSLSKAGYAAAPAAVIGALAHTAPPVPATLLAAIEKIVSGQVATLGSGSGSGAAVASAAAKGGIAMKIVAGVVAAGVLAGAAAVAPGLWGNGPSPLPSPAGRGSEGEGKPAPVNEYKGMQEREEVFEFAEKPKVTKTGDPSAGSGQGKWVITFASKAKCDATVAILDKDGKIVRHLASGVLGVNAPYPFQQGSLAQKLEWDGQTDDFKKAEAAGCKVKVSLGLKPKFERNIAYDPYLMANGYVGRKNMISATGPDGIIYLWCLNYNNGHLRAYGKDGKYLRTVIPPSAAELEKVSTLLGRKVVTTNWGDKSPVGDWFGPFANEWPDCWRTLTRGWATSMAAVKGNNEGKGLVKLAAATEKCVEGAKVEIGPCPAAIPEYKGPPMPDSKVLMDNLWGMVGVVAADYTRELVYGGGIRFDGKTGAWDGAWKTPAGVGGSADRVAVGYDDLIYGRSMGGHDYGVAYVVRYTQNGQMVPFKQHRVDDPDLIKQFAEAPANQKRTLSKDFTTGLGGALMLLPRSDANHTSGFDVAPDGTIIASQTSRAQEPIIVFDRDGKLLTDNAVADLSAATGFNKGDGVYMDRDGNVYAVYGSLFPEGQQYLEGLKCAWPVRSAGGSLIKFRGLGGKYPVGRFHKAGQGPADALKLNKGAASGALWAYGGASQQSAKDCDCAKARFWLDRFARSWVQANQASSVMLLDSNGNRIARLGKYGNVDDTDEDVKAGKDGLRFAWVRSICASDTAMYVADWGSGRILKAALVYAAEEMVPVP